MLSANEKEEKFASNDNIVLQEIHDQYFNFSVQNTGNCI